MAYLRRVLRVLFLFRKKTGTLLTSVNRWSVSRENFVIHIQIGRDQSVSVSVSNVVIGCEQKAWKHFMLSRSTFRNEFMQKCFHRLEIVKRKHATSS